MERGSVRGRGAAGVLLIAAVAFGALPGSAQSPAVTVRHAPFLGWTDAYQVSNGHTTVSVVPSAGGRVLGFSLDGQQALWTNPALRGKLFPVPQRPTTWEGWRNYGGYKLWPAPQSLWPKSVGDGPDPFLDGGTASVELLPQRGLRSHGSAQPGHGSPLHPRAGAGPEDGRADRAAAAAQHRPAARGVVDLGRDADPRAGQKGRGGRSAARGWAPSRRRRLRRGGCSTQAWVFFPANPNSPHKNGILPLGDGQDQWKNEGGLIITDYRRCRGKIGANSLCRLDGRRRG